MTDSKRGFGLSKNYEVYDGKMKWMVMYKQKERIFVKLDVNELMQKKQQNFYKICSLADETFANSSSLWSPTSNWYSISSKMS